MSIVIAIKHDNRVFMGTDSGAFQGWNVTELPIAGAKLSSGPLLIGITGTTRLNNLMGYAYRPPGLGYGIQEYAGRERAHNRPEFRFMDFMVNEFVPQVIETLETARYLGVKDGVAQGFGGEMLVGFGSHCAVVHADFAVTEVVSDYAVGAPCEIARGALFATRNVVNDPRIRIELALTACAHHSASVREPFITGET